MNGFYLLVFILYFLSFRRFDFKVFPLKSFYIFLYMFMLDGGGGVAGGFVELEVCPCGGPHSLLVPAMLSPPESLLMSCIRRGNFMEAHQVCMAAGLKNYFFFLLLLLLMI